MKIKFSSYGETTSRFDGVQVGALGQIPVLRSQFDCGSFSVECICIDNVEGIDANFSSAIDWLAKSTKSKGEGKRVRGWLGSDSSP